MGEKLDDSHNNSTDDKDVSDVLGGAAVPQQHGDQPDADDLNGDRRIMTPHHQLKKESLLVRLLKVVFYVPMKILSLFGFTFGETRLKLSGYAAIDKSPLRAPSTSPQKRKRDEGSISTDEEIDDEVALKLLQDDADYNSQEDEDYKPGEESSCSEEYAEEEDEEEGETSKLSVEDVTEPRPSKLRNPEGEEKVAKDQKDSEKKEIDIKLTSTVAPKCVDEPFANKPEMTPATVGVMG